MKPEAVQRAASLVDRVTRWGGRPAQVLLDAVVVAASFLIAFCLRFEFSIPSTYWKAMLLWLPYVVLAHLFANYAFGVYRILWRYISLYEVFRFVRAIGSVAGVFLLLRLFYPAHHVYFRIPISIIVLEATFGFLGMVGLRFLRRWLYEAQGLPAAASAGEPEEVVIIGAGNNGHTIAREIRLRPELNLTLIGFVDDDPAKRGLEIEGKRVLGGLEDLAALHRRLRFPKALLAITDLPPARKRQVMDQCARLGVRLLVLPGTAELISGRARVQTIREVQIEDLLGRPVTQLTRDDPLLGPVYGRKRILITGAGGSIGSELCRQVARLAPERLILLDKDENNLFYIRAELEGVFPDVPVTARIVDVRDRDKLLRIFEAERPHVTLHAAAYKHVPLMEENPGEAITNNVFGTRNVVDATKACGADVFVMLSTDKAVNPTSVMGATKRIAELIVRQAAEGGTRTRFGSVRFGNVLGSRGSVIPSFREQIARGGPVTVTHPDVMRYFMTIPEASQLVLKAGTLAKNGEIFVLDMGQPVRILDLARDMIRLSGFRDGEIEIRFIGLRPGEKLFEELLVDRDHVIPTPVEKVFVSRPELRDFARFEAQLDALRALASGGDLRAIRRALEEMDIGLREPDSAHANAIIEGQGPGAQG